MTTASGYVFRTALAQRESSRAWPMLKPPPWKFISTGRGLVDWTREERPFEGAVKMWRSIEPGHLLDWEGMAISSSGFEGRGQERYLSSMDRRLERVR